MPNILLDVTRLNTRKRASTPSGIDRVDLRYVEHFDPATTEYVIAWLGCLFLVRKPPFKRLHAGLKSRWQRGEKAQSLPMLLALLQTNPIEFLLVTLRNMLPDKLGWKQRYSAAFRKHLQSADGRWVYINTSHVQIRSIDALRTLHRLAHVQTLFFIHDLIPITHREYVRPGGAEQHRKRLQLLMDTEAHVICNSQYTCDELQKWLDSHAGDRKVGQRRVIPIGVEPRFLVATAATVKRPIQDRYCLMLGTIEPRKNHLLALNVWRRMVEEGQTGIPKLVIIGKRGWENENIVDMLGTLRCHSAPHH